MLEIDGIGGAFTVGDIKTWLAGGGSNTNKSINFIANLSKSIYGSSETVQPTSIKLFSVCRI